MNSPQSHEGWQVWDLAARLSGQLRAIPGAVLGWDMGAALAMGRALGVPALAVVELLPVIEAEMIRKTNEKIEEGRGDGREESIRSSRR
ncbi:hypothetical protein JHW45_00840 [Paracoccus stylophorae]|uniref:Uncharacterized protein n=2 Tax=Paracoccus stylophorae TaxID=659350 RepID=A0ABY7SZC0_9RHOB|nr:hypothetical protein JHW45_00840 [Paracoccus stylophorae]